MSNSFLLYHRARGYGLSRDLWLIQAGILVNALGWGAVLPFEVIYLHDGRGFGLGESGAIVGAITGLGVVASPLAGVALDRFGARACGAWAAALLAVGYTWLAFARTPLEAFIAAAVAGIGNGALGPSQTTLIAARTPASLRHRATAVSRVATNAGFGLGSAVGGVVAAHGLDGMIALLLANAGSYVLYIGVVLVVVRADPPRPRLAGGYREVARDRAFRRLALTNVAVIAVGWGGLPWLLPPFARMLGVSSQVIGGLLFANTVAVVGCQLPAARIAEGRRRSSMLAAGCAVIAAAFVLVAVSAQTHRGAEPLLVAAAAVIGIGECLYTAALTPLTADLAPDALRGRYMATLGLTWWAGLGLAPTLGTPLLARSPTVTFLACAAIAMAAAASMSMLDGRLPEAARRTPRWSGTARAGR